MPAVRPALGRRWAPRRRAPRRRPEAGAGAALGAAAPAGGRPWGGAAPAGGRRWDGAGRCGAGRRPALGRRWAPRRRPEAGAGPALGAGRRYLLWHRSARCGTVCTMADVLAVVAKMGGEVFQYRRQEHQLVALAKEATAQFAETFSERLKAVESQRSASGSAAKTEHRRANLSPYGKHSAGQKPQHSGKPADDKPQSAKAAEGKKPAKPAAKPAGSDMDDGAAASAAKMAAKQFEESMKNDPNGTFDNRVQAVAALQAEFRSSVGSPPLRRLGEKEPCAWLALAGKCKDKKCKSCASGLSFDSSMIQAVRSRCAPGLFGGAKPAPEPG
ncbi:hypothetical protein AB1Y20_001345 [Prymnesium parvum]|uniref:Uncharacterized protein n=1 Tax=Prymnesium parvum TaxID=97485 RepID=A0AB34KDB7_PRYPA